MGAGQGEFCALMLFDGKGRRTETGNRMTIGAGFAAVFFRKLFVMVRGVAIGAGCETQFIGGLTVFVATCTRYLKMLAAQGIAGAVMIELPLIDILPAARGMTGSTVSAQAALMRIIMAIVAFTVFERFELQIIGIFLQRFIA